MPDPRANASHLSAYAADNAGPNLYAGAGTDPSFAMDGPGGPWVGDQTYAPTVGNHDALPDPDRLERRQRHDRRASLRNPFGWWGRVNDDVNRRHAVENVDADGWQERQSVSHYGDDPRWNPPAPDRPTASMSPRTYSFMRPFDQQYARTFDGTHLSMADNRREYDIMTMEPVRRSRNTYRIEPKPWDTDIVDDVPNPNAGLPYEHYEALSVPSMGSRSFRAGG